MITETTQRRGVITAACAVLVVLAVALWLKAREVPDLPEAPVVAGRGVDPADDQQPGLSVPDSAPVEKEPTSKREHRLMLRDIATGQGLPNEEVRLQGETRQSAAVVTTDESGEVQGLEVQPSGIKLGREGWSVVGLTNSASEDEQVTTAWALRRVGLRLTVRTDTAAAGRPAPGPLHIEIRPLPQPGLPPGADAEAPYNEDWLSDAGVRRQHLTRPFDGVVLEETLEVAAVRWLAVRAWTPGWMTSLHEIEFPPADAAGEVSVSLTLHALPRVVVSVHDSEGKRVDPDSLSGYVLLRTRVGEVDFERARLPGAAHSTIERKDGTMLVRWKVAGSRLEDGRWSFFVPPAGELMLVAHGRGHAPGSARIARLQPQNDVSIQLDSSTAFGRSVPLSWRGQLLRETSIVVHNLTDVAHQHAIYIKTDAEGGIPAEWLVRGELYGIRVPGGGAKGVAQRGEHVAGYLRWDGRDAIELSELPRTGSEFVKSER